MPSSHDPRTQLLSTVPNATTNQDNTPHTDTGLAAFDIILATDSLIFALDKGAHLERQGLGLRPLRKQLEQLRRTLAET